MNGLDATAATALMRLRDLVELESPSGDVSRLKVLADALARRWRELGLEVMTVPGPAGDHLVGEWVVPGSTSHVLVLTHYDTVWPVGELERQPFEVTGDAVRGPGVLDMKAGIVALELALERVRASGRAPAVGVRIVAVADEEVSSVDGRRVIEDQCAGAIAVLGLEPSHPDGALKNARRGVARVAVRLSGRAAHAGLAAEQGVSAIDELVDVLVALRRDFPRTADASLNVGRISGGTRANVVAAEAEAEVGLRFATPETERALLELFENLRATREGAVLTAEILSHRPAWPERPDERLTRLVLDTAARLGQSLTARPAGGAGDANFTGARGIPTVDGLGPRGDGAHAVGEWVSLSSLLDRSALLAELLAGPEIGATSP